MKQLGLIIGYLVLNLSGEAQRATLSGRVTDDKGRGMPGATIFIHDIKTGAISDSSGYYKTSSIASGNYLVEVSYQGYSSITEQVHITGNTIKDFSLYEAVAEHQGVIVTGVTSAIKLRQATQPVTLLRKLNLLQTPSTNIIDALTRQPGISAISTGQAIAKPVIRGLGYNRMIVLNDGVRQEGQQWGDEHGIEIDEYSVQRVEILKGPASLMYGSDAMAGVMNFMTNVPVEQGAIKGNLFGTMMDNNDLLGFNANLAGHLKGGFNWNIYGSKKAAGDYTNRLDRKVFNSRFNDKSIGGYIGVNQHWGYAHLLFSNFQQQLGLVEGERDSATGKFLVYPETVYERIATEDELHSKEVYAPYQTIQHRKVTSDNNFNIGKGHLNATVGFQHNQRKEFGDPVSNVPELHFDLKTINYNFQYHPHQINSWNVTIGLNGMQQRNRNLGEEVIIPEYKQLDAGLFAYAKRTLNKYTFTGGLRADIRRLETFELIEGTDLKFSALNKTFSNFSGSAGFSFEASKEITLKANIARGFRAPTVAELLSNGAHEGTDRYEYGTRDLKSETSLQLDGGIELNSEHFGVKLNAFYNHIQNYIFYRRLSNIAGTDSLINVDGEDLQAFSFDQSAATLNGFELSFDLHPHPLDWLHFENSFSFVRGSFNKALEGVRDLPFIPAPKWHSELRGDFKKLGENFQNLYIKFEMEKVSTQERVFYAYNTETPTEGYALFNIGMGTDIGAEGKKLLSLHLSFNNISGVAYQNHLSRLKYTDYNYVNGRRGVFNMGRSFMLKINVPLDFKL